MSRTARYAIGGNVLNNDKDHPVIPSQKGTVCEASGHRGGLVRDSREQAHSYRNRFQIGCDLWLGAAATSAVHATSLDPIMPQTQGSISEKLLQADDAQRANIGRACLDKTGTSIGQGRV